MNEKRTEVELLQDFTAMGHSIALINDVIAGVRMVDETAEERQSCVDRNVEHLVLMKTKDDWGNESMVDADSAITTGNGYTAG